MHAVCDGWWCAGCMVWGPVADMPSAYLRFSLDLLLSLLLLCSFLCFLHGQIDTRVCHNCIHGSCCCQVPTVNPNCCMGELNDAWKELGDYMPLRMFRRPNCTQPAANAGMMQQLAALTVAHTCPCSCCAHACSCCPHAVIFHPHHNHPWAQGADHRCRSWCCCPV